MENGGLVFINYRRGDDPGFTGRLFDHLERSFSRDQLFIDVDNIAPGLDFVEVLNGKVAKSDVLICVIGRGWLDARDEDGNRRLDNPDDFVRIEIAAALRQGKRVIPVLVNGAQMPRTDQLPADLAPLARRNAVRLTHERFRTDCDGLVSAVRNVLMPPPGTAAASAAPAEAQRIAPAAQPFAPSALGGAALKSLLADPVKLLVPLAFLSGVLSSLAVPVATASFGVTNGFLVPGLAFGAVLAIGEYRWRGVRWYTAALAVLGVLFAWVAAYILAFGLVDNMGPPSAEARGGTFAALLAAGLLGGGLGGLLSALSVGTLRRWRRLGLSLAIGAGAGVLLFVDRRFGTPLLYVVWQTAFAGYFASQLRVATAERESRSPAVQIA
jgi:hypothetical protein